MKEVQIQTCYCMNEVYKALNTLTQIEQTLIEQTLIEQTLIKCLEKQLFVLLFTHMPCISEQELAMYVVVFQSYVSKNICHRDCIRLGKGRIHIQNSLVHISCELETSCVKTLYTYKYVIFTRDAYELPCFQALYTIRRRWSMVHSILCLMSKIDTAYM